MEVIAKLLALQAFCAGWSRRLRELARAKAGGYESCGYDSLRLGAIVLQLHQCIIAILPTTDVYYEGLVKKNGHDEL